MAPIEIEIGDVRVRFTGRAEGDLGPRAAGAPAAVERRRRAVLDRPWSWAPQVHGCDVAVVAAPGDRSVAPADALVTRSPGVALAVFTADCAPIALVGEGAAGPVAAAVHAGWRGLVAGVVEVAAAAVREEGATSLRAAVGPCIHAECYEFSPDALESVASRFGDTVRSSTSQERPALDVPAAVRRAVERAGIELVYESAVCTACNHGWFSHRARAERERQAMVVWRE